MRSSTIFVALILAFFVSLATTALAQDTSGNAAKTDDTASTEKLDAPQGVNGNTPVSAEASGPSSPDSTDDVDTGSPASADTSTGSDADPPQGDGGGAPTPDVGISPDTDFVKGAQLISPDPLEPILKPYTDFTDMLQNEIGLFVQLGYTLVFQGASDRISGSPTLTTGRHELIIKWTVIDIPEVGTGTFGTFVEGARVLDHNSQSSLADNIGSSFQVNSNQVGFDIAVAELWYAQGFFKDQVTITIGKIDQTVYFDANRIANDETIQFMSSPLVNNEAIAFPDQGLGAVLTAAPDGLPVYVVLGGGDANASVTEAGFNTIDDGDFFGAVELGYSENIGGLGEGNYRVMGWTTGTDDSGHGSGVALSFDQGIGDYIVPFFRYGYADQPVVDFRHFVSGGIGIESPLGRANDLLAFGVAWADPFDPTLNDETLIEIFYRLQVTSNFAVTPDLQIIIEPADPAASGTVVVGGIRVQATF